LLDSNTAQTTRIISKVHNTRPRAVLLFVEKFEIGVLLLSELLILCHIAILLTREARALDVIQSFVYILHFAELFSYLMSSRMLYFGAPAVPLVGVGLFYLFIFILWLSVGCTVM